jgi:hypothetical protein
LYIKLFFDDNGVELSVVLDKVLPEEFLLVRGLLDFPQSDIGRGNNLVIDSLKRLADALITQNVFGFG